MDTTGQIEVFIPVEHPGTDRRSTWVWTDLTLLAQKKVRALGKQKFSEVTQEELLAVIAATQRENMVGRKRFRSW